MRMPFHFCYTRFGYWLSMCQFEFKWVHGQRRNAGRMCGRLTCQTTLRAMSCSSCMAVAGRFPDDAPCPAKGGADAFRSNRAWRPGTHEPGSHINPKRGFHGIGRFQSNTHKGYTKRVAHDDLRCRVLVPVIPIFQGQPQSARPASCRLIPGCQARLR